MRSADTCDNFILHESIASLRRKRRALLVEDGVDEVRMYLAALEGADWEVWTLSSGARVHAVVSEFDPDVVVMDLQLPDVDGITAMQKLKADPKMHDVPVVVISGHPHRASDAYAAGCHTFLSKPCLPITLTEILDAVWLEEADEDGGV